MRRLLVFILAFSAYGFSQGANTISLSGSGAPAGSCAPVMLYTDTASGKLYNCKLGVWSAVGPGAAGAVTWDSIIAPTAGGLTFQMFANGNALFTVKRKTDTLPTGSFFDFQNAAGGSLCKLNIDGSLTGCTISAASQLPVVDVVHGGTGLATLSAHQLYLGNGTSAPTPIPSGTNGQLLQSLGAGADPGFADPIVSGPDAVGATATKNPVQAGCLFNTTPATITNGQVGAAQCDSVQNILVNLKTALPAGSNVIGHVVADSGSTTAVTGNVAVIKADGSDVTLGAKADAKSTATDTTPITIMSVLKQISASVQAPPSQAVTNAGTFATQDTLSAETTKVIGTVRAQGNVGGVMDAVIGAAAPANVLAAGLKDTSGNSQAALSDTNGRAIVKLYPDTTTTSYHASKKFAASSTTDVAVMPGNATNKVILDKVTLTCTQTTAGQINVELVKRSAADTSGTSASITAVPDYSSYAAAVSAPLSYTGTGPSVGTAVGDLDNAQIGCMAAATATPNDIYVFRPAKPIILNGTAEQVAINLGGAITGGNITVTFDWRETTTP